MDQDTLRDNSAPHSFGWAGIILGVLLFAVGLAGALDRKALVPLLVAVSIPLMAVTWNGPRSGNVRVASRPPMLVVGAAIFTLWAVLSNFWGYSTHFVDLGRVAITVGLAVFAAWGVARLQGAPGVTLDRWVIAGSCVLTAFVLEEELSGAWISTLLHPEPKYQALGPFYRHVFDIAAGGAAVLAPTCIAVAVLIYNRMRSAVLALIYFALAFVACLRGPMAAAPLAVIVGGAAFALGYFHRRLTFTAIFAGFALYVLTAPFISMAMTPPHLESVSVYSNSGFDAEDEVSLRARLGIWHYVAQRVAESPVLGHGFDAARDLSDRNEKLPGTNLPAIPIHPHNGVLQVWLEFGAVGAFIVGGLLWAGWRATARLWGTPLAGATVAGTLVAASILILVSFSLWNTWWLATLGFAATFTVRAVKAQHNQLS